MSRKTFVIDTNVLLHDPLSIKRFQNNDVIIPLVVLEELDSLKRRTDELGKNARAVVRYIDSLKAKNKGNFNEGIILDE
jgi:PhoH-like ATPase